MNNIRRKKLKESKKMIENAIMIITDVENEEQESRDNLPDSLQDSQRASDMDDNISELEEIISNAEDVVSAIECLI
jgi:DNA repair ATPase RecN